MGEGRYVVPPPDRELAPIELEFSGADTPVLVELRRAYPALSAILEPTAQHAGSFRSAPLPAGDYEVFAWHPVLGTWKEHGFRHDPRRPQVHPLSWPATATLVIELELPEGLDQDEIEVALLVPSFHRNGLGILGTGNARRLLAWSEREHAFVGCLAPGTYPVLVRGGGLCETHQTIALAPGAVDHLSLAPRRGIETTVFFESTLGRPVPGRGSSRGLQPAEHVQLDALTPTGSIRLELLGKDQRRVAGGFEFTVWLPLATTELCARTKLDANESFHPRAGCSVLAPGTLEAARGRPRVRILLSNVPSAEER
jgi:hypothetical protein